MDRIRILYIDEVSRIAGGENWFLNFVDGLENRAVEPVMLCPEGPFAQAVRSRGVEVIPYRFRMSDVSSRRLWRYLLFVLMRMWDSIAVNRIMKKRGISLVHSVNTSGHVIAALLRRFFGRRALWHIHHEHHLLLYRLFRPDHIVFVGMLRQKILRDLSLVNTVAHSVLYNGIDPRPYERCTPRTGKPSRIGCVGRLTPEKGVETFLEAAEIVKNTRPDVRFDIYGEEIYDETLRGGYTALLEKKILDLNLEDTVTLCGFVHPPEDIYSSLDIFVMPSHRTGESCPMVILESWAAGVPVVAAASGGIPELIVEGETGCLVPPKDPRAIADAVLSLLDDPPRTAALAERARALVRERFDFRKHARQFVNLYRELLHEKL